MFPDAKAVNVCIKYSKNKLLKDLSFNLVILFQIS